jgi:hypothetical protein
MRCPPIRATSLYTHEAALYDWEPTSINHGSFKAISSMPRSREYRRRVLSSSNEACTPGSRITRLKFGGPLIYHHHILITGKRNVFLLQGSSSMLQQVLVMEFCIKNKFASGNRMSCSLHITHGQQPARMY